MYEFEDPLAKMSTEQLARLAGGDVGQMPWEQSLAINAAEKLQSLERPLSPGSQHAGKMLLAGEGLKLAGGVAFRKNPVVSTALGKYGWILDAGANLAGAQWSTDAGDDKYGRTYYDVNGKLQKVNPIGTDAASIGLDALESIASAGQYYWPTAAFATAIAGEGTEGKIHTAKREDVQKLTDIAFRRGQYADVEAAVKDLAMMNDAPAEPGKIGAPLWDSLRLTKQALVNDRLKAIRAALGSKDKAQIDAAAEDIPHIAAYLDKFNADMEAVQTSSQEITWPWARLGEWISDELTPGLVSTMSAGGPDGTGAGLNYVSPQQAREAFPSKRPQGQDLMDELHRRALMATNNVDPRDARDKKEISRIAARKETNSPTPAYYF